MDTTNFSESAFVTPELVKNSASKILVVVDEAKGKESDFGEQLCCTVQIDGKTKTWRMNRESVKNMQALGSDSKFWIGKKVQLLVMSPRGKEQVFGTPIIDIKRD